MLVFPVVLKFSTRQIRSPTQAHYEFDQIKFLVEWFELVRANLVDDGAAAFPRHYFYVDIEFEQLRPGSVASADTLSNRLAELNCISRELFNRQ